MLFEFQCKDCGDRVLTYVRFGHDRQQCSLCHYISCIPDEEARERMRVALRKTETVVQTPGVADDDHKEES